MKNLAAIVSISVIFLVSCLPNPNKIIGDGGILSDQSSGPPRFWDMTPGVTRESEVWDILTKRGVSQSCKNFDYRSLPIPGGRGIDCAFPPVSYSYFANFGIGLEAQPDTITWISFTPSNIYLRDVIKKYGEPSSVEIYEEGEEHVFVDVTIFYDDISTVLYLPSSDGFTYDLRSESQIGRCNHDQNHLAVRWKCMGPSSQRTLLRMTRLGTERRSGATSLPASK